LFLSFEQAKERKGKQKMHQGKKYRRDFKYVGPAGGASDTTQGMGEYNKPHIPRNPNFLYLCT